MITEALSDLKQMKGLSDRCYLEEKDNKSVRVVFDSVDSESWTGTSTISNHAIEKGQDISDHFKLGAESVSLTITLTNHTGISSMDSGSLARVYGFDNVEDLVTARLNVLDDWRKNGTLLRYYGAVKENVENLVITNLGPSKSDGGSDASSVSLNLQKVVIAEYQETGFLALPFSARTTLKKGLVKKITKTVIDFL